MDSFDCKIRCLLYSVFLWIWKSARRLLDRVLIAYTLFLLGPFHIWFDEVSNVLCWKISLLCLKISTCTMCGGVWELDIDLWRWLKCRQDLQIVYRYTRCEILYSIFRMWRHLNASRTLFIIIDNLLKWLSIYW